MSEWVVVASLILILVIVTVIVVGRVLGTWLTVQALTSLFSLMDGTSGAAVRDLRQQGKSRNGTSVETVNRFFSDCDCDLRALPSEIIMLGNKQVGTIERFCEGGISLYLSVDARQRVVDAVKQRWGDEWGEELFSRGIEIAHPSQVRSSVVTPPAF